MVTDAESHDMLYTTCMSRDPLTEVLARQSIRLSSLVTRVRWPNTRPLAAAAYDVTSHLEHEYP